MLPATHVCAQSGASSSVSIAITALAISQARTPSAGAGSRFSGRTNGSNWISTPDRLVTRMSVSDPVAHVCYDQSRHMAERLDECLNAEDAGSVRFELDERAERGAAALRAAA